MVVLNKTEIDWSKAREYVAHIIPALEPELRSRLNFLDEVQPICSLTEYPPRIEMKFIPRGGIFGPSSPVILGPQEKEIRSKEIEIAESISEVAERFRLKADKGTFGRIKRLRFYNFDLGTYTFSPDYQQFRRQE